MKKRYLALIAITVLGAVAIFNQKSLGDRYADEVAEHSLSSWHTKYVIQPSFGGVIWNAIPGIHLLGLAFDTIIVYKAIPEVIYGIGAITARDKSCPGLLQVEDEDLFWAWEDGHQREVMSTFASVLQAKKDRMDQVVKIRRQLTATAHHLITNKVQKKVMSKVAVKISAKAAGKALLGFIPLFGPLAAGAINWYILGNIYSDAEEYFAEKAKIICH